MSYVQINDRLIPQQQYVSPTTGSVVSVNSGGLVNVIINPESSLLNLTITLPSQPEDGDVIHITSSQSVTNLTIEGGEVIGGVSSLSEGQPVAFIYDINTNKWFRFS